MERGIVMLGHSLMIGLVSYLLMVYAMGQSAAKAENRSLIVGAVALIYMIVFGHKMPSASMNPSL